MAPAMSTHSRSILAAALAATLAATLAAAFTAGCGTPDEIPEAEFAGRAAQVLCDRTRECMRGAYDAYYFGMSDCETHFERSMQELVDLLGEADCTYDAKQAAIAYADVQEMTCEQFYEGEYAESVNEIWGEDCGGISGTIVDVF